MRTPEQWHEELEQHGLGPFAPMLLKHWQPCIRVRLEQAGELDWLTGEVRDEVEIGRSKVGGFPDAPRDFVWPTFQDEETHEAIAVEFLAQIRLEEVAPFDEEEILPRQGLLLFFFDFNAWEVIFVADALDQLERQSLPAGLPEFGVHKPHRLHFSQADSMPLYYAPEIEAAFGRIAEEEGLTPDLNSLVDAYHDLKFEGEVQHQMLGHEATGNGRDGAVVWMRGSDFNQPAPKEDMYQWRVLFELQEGDPNADLILGSGSGTIGFLIRNEDLKNADFENVYGGYLK